MRIALVLALVGCGPSSTSKPAGTPTDPVVTCERFGDVCKIDNAKLGVCAHKKAGGGFACASQH